ncbi:hypothetical protein TNCV_4434301 [Trichonephila clavipes]|nr:hypothetical protein TNCV_4434301 [Trichonephila clavipes]
MTDFDSPRIITSTIIRLRIHHYKGMNRKQHCILIKQDLTYSEKTARKSNRSQDNISSSTQLSPQEYLTRANSLIGILKEILYSQNVPESAIVAPFGAI